MSAATFLLPANAGQRPSPTRVGAGAIDVVHDHVLRLVGDAEVAATVAADVARRASDRVAELGTAVTLEDLLRSAHARLAPVADAPPAADVVDRLAGREHPAGRALVVAMSTLDRRRAALLDLTARHGLDLRDAAAIVGVDRSVAAQVRTEALRHVRLQVADAGVRLDLDVEATLAELPLVAAPEPVHAELDAPVGTTPRRALPAGLAWAGTGAVAVMTVLALGVGLPRALASHQFGEAPVAVAVAVTDGPAVRQLTTPATGVPAEPVEQLESQPQSQGPVAPESEAPVLDEAPVLAPEAEPEATPDPAPSDEADPAEPTDEQPSEEPSPEPSTDPLELPLPTGP